MIIILKFFFYCGRTYSRVHNKKFYCSAHYWGWMATKAKGVVDGVDTEVDEMKAEGVERERNFNISHCVTSLCLTKDYNKLNMPR